jgi:tetratricopeptide (TPR) repeat protein
MQGLASVSKALGRYEEAEKLYFKIWEITRRTLGKQHPTTLKTGCDLAGVYKAQDRYEEAEKLYAEILRIRRRTPGREHPATLSSMYNLASVYRAQDRYEEAEELYSEALEMYRRTLGREHPATLKSMHNLAKTHCARGQYDKAEQLYAEALEVRSQTLGEEDPDTLRSTNSLAWFLASCPELARRDPDRALRLMTRATELAPQEGNYWNTLGVAQYRSGNWQAAIEALQKSIELRSGGSGFDYFFQAMAHWQLGEKKAARTWYDRATQWMDNNKPNDEELKRFRAEATELLGMEAASPDKANSEAKKPEVESAVDDAEGPKDTPENQRNGAAPEAKSSDGVRFMK